MSDDLDLEIDNSHTLEELAAIGRHLRETGECFFRQTMYEEEIHKLTEKLKLWDAAYTRAEKINPDHPLLPRAKTIMAGFATDLDALRYLFLKSWRPDRRRPN
jgi:hypothetical protein